MITEKARPLVMVTWRCTRDCTGNCIYCSYTSAHAVDKETDTQTAYKIVDEVYDFGSAWFGISGGEPLARHDIFDVISYAKETGLNVSLITSGFAFDEKRLDKLVRNEVRTAVSIDGARASNDQIRGRGSYDKAVFAMKKLSENGILDCLVTTLTKYNLRDIEHIVAIAEEFNARMVVFHNLVPVGRAGSNMPDLAPSPEEYEEVFSKIYDLQVRRTGKLSINVYAPFYARIVRQRNPVDFWDWFTKRFIGKCTIGGNYIGITENADYRSCGFHEYHRLGNLKYKGLKATWEELQNSEIHLKLRDKSNIKGKCGVCEYREICGGCRTRAEHYTGDLFESDPACAYVPRVIREDMEKNERTQVNIGGEFS